MNVNGQLSIHHNANYVLVRFANIKFLSGFSNSLTEASAVWEGARCRDIGSWPPEEEVTNIIVHSIGTRLVCIIFWACICVLM